MHQVLQVRFVGKRLISSVLNLADDDIGLWEANTTTCLQE